MPIRIVDRVIGSPQSGIGGLNPSKFTYTGNASTTAFSIPLSAFTNNPANYRVEINGVTQEPVTDYFLSGSNIVFTSAPLSGEKVVIVANNIVGSYDFNLPDGSVTTAKLSNNAVEQSFVVATGTLSARSLQDRFSDVVNVKDFGAKGDGVTDDTAAIQAAINVARGRFKNTMVDLQSGSYLITAPLLINSGECGIYNGTLSAANTFTAPGSAILRLTTGLRITVQDIVLKCGFIADGIHCVTGGFANKYEHIEIQEFKNYGIRLFSTSGGDQRISDCLITQSGSVAAKRTGVCVSLETGDIKLHDCVLRYAGKCLYISASTQLVNNCHFYNGNANIDTPLHNSINIEINGGSGQTISNCYIDKGRIVLKTFANHFVGNRYLFTTFNPEHDSIFLFDAGAESNKAFPENWVHVGHRTTLPITNSTIPFVQLSATSGGSWSTDVQNLVSTLQTFGTIPYSTSETVNIVPQISQIYYKSDTDANIRFYGGNVTFPPVLDWSSSKITWRSDSGMTHAVQSQGTLTTGGMEVEGSRTGSTGSCCFLRFKDRRGSADINLPLSAVGYYQFNLYGNTGSNPNSLTLETSDPDSSDVTERYRWTTSAYLPGADNTQTLGSATKRWSIVYAGTGTINTSDEREKQQIETIDETIFRAWSKVQFKQFKFNNAVAIKGIENARVHIGLIAQKVKEAFESEGLDAFKYGLLCYDEWEDGNRYGIRYEEALALECAYQRRITESTAQELKQLKRSLGIEI